MRARLAGVESPVTLGCRGVPLAGLVCSLRLVLLGVQAEILQLQIDPTRSSLELRGSVVKFGLNFSLNPQAEGSLRTTARGTVSVEVTTSSIRFLEGAELQLDDSGVWEPGWFGVEGSAPARWGARAGSDLGALKIVGVVAGRDWKFDAFSPELSLTNAEFSSRPLRWTFAPPRGPVVDYRFLTTFRDVDPDSGSTPRRDVSGFGLAREPVLSAGRFELEGTWTNRTQVRGRWESVDGVPTLTLPAEMWTEFSAINESGELYRFHWILAGQLVAVAMPQLRWEPVGEDLRVEVHPAFRLQRATRLSPADWEDLELPAGGVLPRTLATEFFRAVWPKADLTEAE